MWKSLLFFKYIINYVIKKIVININELWNLLLYAWHELTLLRIRTTKTVRTISFVSLTLRNLFCEHTIDLFMIAKLMIFCLKLFDKIVEILHIFLKNKFLFFERAWSNIDIYFIFRFRWHIERIYSFWKVQIVVRNYV